MELFTIKYTGNNEDDVTYFADADIWQECEVWDEKESCYKDGIILKRHDRGSGIELLEGDRLIWRDDLLEVVQKTSKQYIKELAFW